MFSSLTESVGDLQAKIAKLEKENDVLRKIVNTIRSDSSDVDLISYVNGDCLLFPYDGAWKIKLAGETEWIQVADVNEIVAKLSKEN